MTPAAAYALYLIISVGGAGLCLLLGDPSRSRSVAGAILGLSAVGALFVLLGLRLAAPDASTAMFYLFSAIAVVAAARVVTHRRPIYSALYFVLVVLAVAALLVLQQAEFLALALIILYAGAIMVTYLFVIMLAQPSGAPAYDRHSREPLLAVLLGFLVMAAIAGRAGDWRRPEAAPGIPVRADVPGSVGEVQSLGNTTAIGAELMTKYIMVVEIGGVLLLVAMVGAVAMARKRVPVEGWRRGWSPIGRVGKEVEPF